MLQVHRGSQVLVNMQNALWKRHKHKKDANEHHINVFVCFNVVIEQLSGKEHVLNHLSIPAACFTHPEISMVGLTEVTVF